MNKILTILLLVVFSVSCQKSIKIKGVKASITDVEATITTTTTGTVEAKEQAVLNFNTVGRIEKKFTQKGARVKKGKLLASLENRDIIAVFENATKEKYRSKELFDAGLVSQTNLDETNKAYEIAKSNLEKTQIHAPFDGIISDLNLTIGELSQTNPAKENPPILLVDEKPRVIKGEIDEVDLSKVKPGFAARVRIPAVRVQAFLAKVTRIIPYVSTTKEQERTAQVELQLEDNKIFIPAGASAEIEIIVAMKKNTLSVPTRTLLGTGAKRHLFTFKKGRVYKTIVELGVGNYDRTEILSGISENEVVVYPGDIELEDRLKISVEIEP